MDRRWWLASAARRNRTQEKELPFPVRTLWLPGSFQQTAAHKQPLMLEMGRTPRAGQDPQSLRQSHGLEATCLQATENTHQIIH